MDLRQSLQLNSSLQLVQQLRQELGKTLGKFEGQILDMVEFVDIDLDEPQSQYHLDMLRTLLVRESEEQNSLLGDVVAKRGLTEKEIQKITVESYKMEDLGFDIGTKRNVDLVKLVFEDGKELIMTVSMDKAALSDLAFSPSTIEANTLGRVNNPSAWCVQQYFGYRVSEDKEGKKGIVCKEYLPGHMLANYTFDVEMTVEQYGQETMIGIARAVGEMARNALDTLGGIPVDSNPYNIILYQTEEERLYTRYCDVEGIRADEKGIKHELGLLRQQFGSYARYFDEGMNSTIKSPLG